MKKMNKKGFTIVELVIVIAVIGILAGVLIPTFTIVVRKANESAAIQALDTARKELSTFVDAAEEDFSAFDATYIYSYTVEKKGQNYTNLAGLWQYDNGEWKQIADTTKTEVYDYTKADAYTSGTYYSDKNGTVASDVVDAASFAAHEGTLYTRAALSIQGVAIYKKTA